MSRNISLVDDRIDKLNSNTKKIIDEFLTFYESKVHYRSALSIMFVEVLEKDDACSVSYDDYLKIENDMTINETTQKYMISFIRYLYSFDYIHDNNFDKKFTKEKAKNDFINRKNRMNGNKNSDVEKSEIDLTYDKILKITEFLKEKESESNAIMTYSFYWYLLFELGIDKGKIDKVKLDKDFNGINLNLEGYIFNEKYINVLNELSGKKYGNKTKKLNVYEIKKLGTLLDIENLIPQIISNARKKFTMICPSCENTYLNTYNNWFSFNNFLICKHCAEDLKKKSFLVKPIENQEVEILTQEEKKKLELVTQTYDEILKKMDTIDYLKIHEWNMEIGKLGEAFVYDLEYNKLINTEWVDKIDKNKALNPINGYDILSFDKNGNEIYIEVKTTTEKNEQEFFISAHELEIAKMLYNQNKKYYIYRVFNILAKDKNDIGYFIYDNIFDNKFSLLPENYRVISNENV